METRPAPKETAARLHQIAKQILRGVIKLQDLATRFEQNDSTEEASEVRKEYLEPLVALLGEVDGFADLDAVVARFVRAALALKLDPTRRKFRNIEASSVHGLTIQMCCFFLRLWDRSFALKPGDPIPENAVSRDFAELCTILTKFLRTLPHTDDIPDAREFLLVGNPAQVGLRWFLKDSYTCLHEWNPTPLVADLEGEFHTASLDDNSPAKTEPQSVRTGPTIVTNVGEGEPLTGAERDMAFQGLTPAERKAYLAFFLAESKQGCRLEDREAHKLLDEEGISTDQGDLGELTDYELPNFDTWSRQLRRARMALQEQKYKRRGKAPATRSIVKGSQLENQTSDE